MGLFSGISSFVSNAVSTIGDAIGSFFGGGSSSSSSSGGSCSSPIPSYSTTTNRNTTTTTSHTTTTNYNTTTTTYEPDRVKAAELENERIELMRRAKLDIIQAETQSRIAQEQARAQGFTVIAQAITAMQEKLNDIAEKRIAIIERGTLRAVMEAESFYSELEANIRADNDRYTTEKLPALIEILNQYEKDSPAYKIYMKKIEGDVSLQIAHCDRQLASVLKRQEKMIDEILAERGRIADQTGQITAEMLESVKAKIAALDSDRIIMPELPNVQGIPALPQ